MNAAYYKKYCNAVFIFLCAVISSAQNYVVIKNARIFQQQKKLMDSLVLMKTVQQQDTNAVKYFIDLSSCYWYFSYDSALLGAGFPHFSALKKYRMCYYQIWVKYG